MLSVAVVTPTIGSKHLFRCLQSVSEQTYPNVSHYVVIDGWEYKEKVAEALEHLVSGNPVKTITLSCNIGAHGDYGHRVYAACPFLVDADVVCYLDEDNWFEGSHVESMVRELEGGGYDWVYSLRKIYDENGELVCEDNCESLGDWPISLSDPEGVANHLVDTSCYAVRRPMAAQISPFWAGEDGWRLQADSTWGQDRIVYHVLSKKFPNFACTGRHTACYRRPSTKCQPFLTGNRVKELLYGNPLPWCQGGGQRILSVYDRGAHAGTELMAQRIEQTLTDLLPPETWARLQITHQNLHGRAPGRKNIIVLTCTPWGTNKNRRCDCDRLVFVSHTQQVMFQTSWGIPLGVGIVIPNGCEAFPKHCKPDPDKMLRLMYWSVPERGLDVLYCAFDMLSREHDNIELNVFSSFDLYGRAEEDARFSELIAHLVAHPNINYSRSVPNSEIRKEIMRSHILAYPSTHPETSCLVLIEAMMGGLVCVHSSLAALPETSMGLTDMYQFTEDKALHVSRCHSALTKAIMAYRDPGGRLKISESNERTVTLATEKYGWGTVQNMWLDMVRALLADDVPRQADCVDVTGITSP